MEAVEGEDRLLDRPILRPDFFGELKLLEGFARHDPGGEFGERLLRFKPATSNKVRIRITKSRVAPTISEFGLYASPRPGGTLEMSKALLGDQTTPVLWRKPAPDAGEEDKAHLAAECRYLLCPDCGVVMVRKHLPRPRAPPKESDS